MQVSIDNQKLCKSKKEEQRTSEEDVFVNSVVYDKFVESNNYWKEVGKQEAEQKNEYNHRVIVIKQVVELMLSLIHI